MKSKKKNAHNKKKCVLLDCLKGRAGWLANSLYTQTSQCKIFFKFRDITDIFVPHMCRTINVLTKSGFERLQPSPRYQIFTIIYV